eukprot:3222639-Pyramimonas_sp.AAC.1
MCIRDSSLACRRPTAVQKWSRTPGPVQSARKRLLLWRPRSYLQSTYMSPPTRQMMTHNMRTTPPRRSWLRAPTCERNSPAGKWVVRGEHEGLKEERGVSKDNGADPGADRSPPSGLQRPRVDVWGR